MADKSSTGAVHLTTLDLDVSKVFEQLNSIDTRIKETAELARNTPVVLGASGPNTQNPLGEGQEQATQSINATRTSIERLIGQYLNLEKTITQFRATGGNEVFQNISSGINVAISSLQEFSKILADGGKLAKEDKQEIAELREQLVIFSNSVKDADNALLKSGESINSQKNKIASLAENYNKLLTAFSKSGLDINYSQFNKLQQEATESAKTVNSLYESIKNGKSITSEQALQFSSLTRSLSDYRLRLSELKKDAELTGQGLIKLNEQSPNFANSIKAIEFLELKYRNFILSMEKDKTYTKDVFGSIPTSARNAVNEIVSLNDAMKNSGTVTQEQAQRINQLGDNFRQLQINLSAVKEEAQRTGQGLIKLNESAPDFSKYLKSVESLTLQYKNFQNTLAKSKLDPSQTALGGIQQQADEAANRLAELSMQMKQNGTVTKDQVKEFESLSSTLKNLKGQLKDAETEAIKTGTGFKDLETKAEQSGGAVSKFLNRLADKAKWMLAYQLITLVRQSFSNIIGAIKETEDTVVELQRVLNEDISAKTISDELHDMAYEFGQSFENVSDIAVKFAQTGASWQETIDATRATMLGLNTAELEVTTATQGLIAVMAQFKMDASELESVIDKINITADNFPITSEKIVAALQRAGGTAYNFGLTLEETIGVITALGEATGRSGENIGTALNSLITFSMKASSLETFSKYLGDIDLQGKDVLEIWQLLGAKIDDSEEALATMMAGSKEFSELFNEELATAIGLTDEYNAAMMNSQDVYSAVGTYRQNYFIALINNISEVINVLNNMSDAEGYSLAENEKYMDTLTAQWEQLIIVARELAVQFGESGFLKFAKDVVALTTGALKLTNALGGLRTVFVMLAASLLTIKVDKIKTFLLDASTGIKNLGTSIKNIVGSLNIVKTYQDAYNRSLEQTAIDAAAAATAEEAAAIKAAGAATALASGISAILGPLMIIGTVISIGVGLWNSYQNHLKEVAEEAKKARQELISLGKEAETNGKELATAVKELEDAKLSGVSEDIEDATLALLEFLGYSKEDIPALIKPYQDLETEAEKLDAALQSLVATEYEAIKVAAIGRKEAAEKSFQDISTYGDFDFSQISEETNKASKAFYLLANAGYAANTSMEEFGKVSLNSLTTIPKNIEEAKGQLEILDKQIEHLKGNMTSKELTGNEVYESLVTMRKAIKDVVDNVDDADEFLELLGDNASEYFQNMRKAIEEAETALSDFSNSGLINLAEDIETLGELFDELSGKVDDFQSAYSSVLDIIEEYNETGIMTADMLQTILELEPQYIEMLNVQGNALSLNQDAVNNLVGANDNYLQQLAALKIAKEVDKIATDMQAASAAGLTAAEYTAAYAATALGGDVYNAALQMIQGTGTADDFANALFNVAESARLSGDWLDVFTGQALNFATQISSLLNLTQPNKIRTYYTPKTTTKKSSSSSKKSPEEEALKREKESIKEIIRLREDEIYFMEKSGASADEMIAKYKEMQSAVHAQTDKYRAMGYKETDDFVREMGKKFWELQEKIEKALSGIYDSIVDAYKNAIDALEHDYEHLADNLDYSGMSENLKKQIEYQIKMQEAANAEFERLLSKGVDVNDDAVQSIVKTWRDACNEINSLNERLAENILETYESFISLADSFEVWDRLDVSKVEILEKELREINSLYEEGSISLAKYKELLESVGKTYLDARLEELEKQQEDIEHHYKDIIDNYNKEIDEIRKRKDASDKYYDGLIDQLRDVEESNERINAQLDYYAERQKILRNLEQAQARSGVEWREKEIEYQEQLADLDKDWQRTQEDWKITDQIEALEKLKQEAADNFEAAIERIEEYIDAAEKESEEAIAAISAEMEDLKEKIYRAITEELATAKKNADELKASMSGIADDAKPSIENLSKYLENTLNGSINNVSTNLVNQITKAGETASKSLAKSFTNNFVTPISSQISSLMKDATSSAAVSKATTSSLTPSKKNTYDDNSLANQIRRDEAAMNKNTGSSTTANKGTNNVVNLYADFGKGAATGAINTLMNKMQDFFTQPFKR